MKLFKNTWKILILAFALNFTVNAEEVRIISWNVEAKFTPPKVEEFSDEFELAAEFLKPDILLLQEVSSIEVVNKIRDVMGLNGFDTACSQYNQDHTKEYGSLETGIISRFPLTHVVEFDPSPDNRTYENDPDERMITAQPKLGIAPTRTSRGFIWARIDAIKLTVCNTHLKSARGKVGLEDGKNAQQREFVAAAIAESVLDDMNYFPGYSYLIAGDLNVGQEDTKKNGTNLFEDCYSDCGDRDLYDDTHGILGAGIYGGLKMKNVTLPIKKPTYPGFPGSPIDCIYVAGAGVDNFSDGVLSLDTFGSDHRPVYTVFTVDDVNMDAPRFHGKNHLLSDNEEIDRAAQIEQNRMANAKPIVLTELKNHIGEYVKIKGKVTNTNNIGNITFINFGDRGSGMPVMVIFQENYGKWQIHPEQLYRGKTIEVTGPGSDYRGTSQIVIKEPAQVRILD